MSLQTITKELGEHYRSWKKEEKDKEKKRKEFFDAATEEIKKKTLARKTIRVAEDSKEDAWEYVSTYYPKWKILSIFENDVLKSDSTEWFITLEENPEYKQFVYVNPDDGYVYTKTITDGSVIVDTERIQREDPKFWEQISYVPDRELKSLEELNKEQFEKLKKYTYRGKPQVKLSSPRKAKPEELALSEDNNS